MVQYPNQESHMESKKENDMEIEGIRSLLWLARNEGVVPCDIPYIKPSILGSIFMSIPSFPANKR